MNRDKPAKDNCVCELIVLARVSAVSWHGHCLTTPPFPHRDYTLEIWIQRSTSMSLCQSASNFNISMLLYQVISCCRYALVKLFEPFGKITLMDFLFHFSGPKRGQPRGYCFLEYSSKQVKKPEEFKNIHIQLYKCKLSPRSRLTKG